ncbi:MAG: bacterial/archaeal transporter family protein [Phycisphaerales bacterium]|jgi:transporter family protein|nr:bacterial/archaeal transporter family protein [Phycisphaerales bacterium]
MPPWLLYAILSALAASLVGVFGRLGVQKIDDNLATTVRSIVMTLMLLGFATVIGAWDKLGQLRVGPRPMLAILLSGAAGATSWIFYFKALKLAEVSKVAPIDKLSMPLGILLAVIFLRERPSMINWLGVLLIAGGAYLATLQRT